MGLECAQFIRLPMERRMSHHDHSHDSTSSYEPDPRDSRADAIAAFLVIAIAVSGILFFISQQ
jgi:hypothetical protein